MLAWASTGHGNAHTTYRPEQVRVLVFINRKYLPSRRHHLHLEHIVRREPVVRRHNGVATSRHVAPYPDRLASAANDNAAVLVSNFVDVEHLRPGSGGDGVAVYNLARSGELEVAFVV